MAIGIVLCFVGWLLSLWGFLRAYSCKEPELRLHRFELSSLVGLILSLVFLFGMLSHL